MPQINNPATKVRSCRINGGVGPTFAFNSGDFASVTRLSIGEYNVVFNSPYATAYAAVANANNFGANPDVIVQANTASLNQVYVTLRQSGAYVDQNFSVMTIGS